MNERQPHHWLSAPLTESLLPAYLFSLGKDLNRTEDLITEEHTAIIGNDIRQPSSFLFSLPVELSQSFNKMMNRQLARWGLSVSAATIVLRSTEHKSCVIQHRVSPWLLWTALRISNLPLARS
jgi:hypothetical protein